LAAAKWQQRAEVLRVAYAAYSEPVPRGVPNHALTIRAGYEVMNGSLEPHTGSRAKPQQHGEPRIGAGIGAVEPAFEPLADSKWGGRLVVLQSLHLELGVRDALVVDVPVATRWRTLGLF
jgi:hypothetical protein